MGGRGAGEFYIRWMVIIETLTPQTWHILQNCPFTSTEVEKDPNQIGIARLLSTGAFCAAYPLHEASLHGGGGGGEDHVR